MRAKRTRQWNDARRNKMGYKNGTEYPETLGDGIKTGFEDGKLLLQAEERIFGLEITRWKLIELLRKMLYLAFLKVQLHRLNGGKQELERKDEENLVFHKCPFVECSLRFLPLHIFSPNIYKIIFKRGFNCSTCNIAFQTRDLLEAHYSGRNHRRKSRDKITHIEIPWKQPSTKHI